MRKHRDSYLKSFGDDLTVDQIVTIKNTMNYAWAELKDSWCGLFNSFRRKK